MKEEHGTKVQAFEQNLLETKNEYDNKTQALKSSHKKVVEKNKKDMKTID